MLDSTDKYVHSSESAIYDEAEEQSSHLKSNEFTSSTWHTREAFKIGDPVRLLTIYDQAIRTQKTKLHSWQIKVMLAFAYNKEPDKVLRMCVRANNGSGKSQYCIAPCAVWLCMAHTMARSVVTSSSGTQLDRQSGKKIVMLCQQINETHGQILWKINYRFLTFLPTGSTIELYATDDAGKAEGYHPHSAGSEFAIFVDEAKNVSELIYEAISRCNGMTRRMNVSSPGSPKGHFYTINFSNRWIKFVVTYKECPHISQDEVDEAKERYGENSPWFRSAYLAEFTSVDEELIITWEAIQKCLRIASQWAFRIGARFGGLDLSAGGDENVFTPFEGNVQLALECFRYDDTTLSVPHIKRLIHKYDVPPENINADDGGVGKVMIDMLWRDGYMVNRVLNNSAAFNTDQYANLGAEMWFNLARIITECDIVLIPDSILINQLSSRYYKRGDVLGKIALESKRIARNKGHGSPDRADATVLALANKSFPLSQNISAKDRDKVVKPTRETLEREFQRKKCEYSGIDNALERGTQDKALNRIISDYGEMLHNINRN